jgi:hypothetical protein
MPGSGGIGILDTGESAIFGAAVLAALIAVALLIAGILRRGLRAKSNAAFAVLFLLMGLVASPAAAGMEDWARWALSSVGTVLAVGIEVVTDMDEHL